MRVGLLPVPLRATLTEGVCGSFEAMPSVAVAAPSAVGSKPRVTVHVSACAGEMVRTAALALETSTGPSVDETTLTMRKATLPVRVSPFCPMMRGWAPRFFSATVWSTSTLPTPSLSTGPKLTARSVGGVTESVMEMSGSFKPVPLRATVVSARVGSLLAMRRVSVRAPTAVGSKRTVAVQVSALSGAICFDAVVRSMAPATSLVTLPSLKWVPVAKVMPFWEMVSGAWPEFFKVTVAEDVTRPAPSAWVPG